MTDLTELTAYDEARYAGRCWAMLPDALLALDRLLAAGTVLQLDDETTQAAHEAARQRGVAKINSGSGGAVAVVPLQGAITPEGSFLQMLLGIPGGLKKFTSDFGEVMADPDVRGVVLNVDSPGGIVDQVPETAAMIRQATKTKPVVAVANPMAASAAYWLASQGTQVIGSTSSETGSIGVYQLHRDLSQAHAMAGIKPTLISAGKYKVEGNPFEPLSNEAEKAIQQAVNDYFEMFVKDVAAGRNVAQTAVRNGYGEGRVLTAMRAQKAGLIDGVATLGEVVNSLASGKLPGRQRKSLGDTSWADDYEFEVVADDEMDVDVPEAAKKDYSTEDKSRILAALA
jgi:capsid assembly protease